MSPVRANRIYRMLSGGGFRSGPMKNRPCDTEIAIHSLRRSVVKKESGGMILISVSPAVCGYGNEKVCSLSFDTDFRYTDLRYRKNFPY